ncbi:MAG TPA: MBL fold metallo-hydrolase [Gemmatimonadales bacterium]|nr:MBL fold metallo-hydrolase [Gemmatimonadales bacterium]
MTLTQSFTLGSLHCHLLEGGRLRLDGGAMFGVVPKPLWSRKAEPDDRNRIQLAMRCLLIEHPDGLVLVDTALGDKEDEKFRDIYAVENEGRPGPTRLEDAIREAGFAPGDVRWVINTHLHFDHAGGNTVVGPGGSAPIVAFPNATYVVQRKELEFARHTNERTRASYMAPNFEPVAAAGKWRLLDGESEILPGIHARLTPGHVPWHQSLVLRSGGETAVFLGDVAPTSAHLPLAYIMGYDLEPLRTLEAKRTLLADAVRDGWWLIFEHDPDVAMGRAVVDGKGTGLAEVRGRPGS